MSTASTAPLRSRDEVENVSGYGSVSAVGALNLGGHASANEPEPEELTGIEPGGTSRQSRAAEHGRYYSVWHCRSRAAISLRAARAPKVHLTVPAIFATVSAILIMALGFVIHFHKRDGLATLLKRDMTYAQTDNWKQTMQVRCDTATP